jgi:hypothetical protein
MNSDRRTEADIKVAQLDLGMGIGVDIDKGIAIDMVV